MTTYIENVDDRSCCEPFPSVKAATSYTNRYNRSFIPTVSKPTFSIRRTALRASLSFHFPVFLPSSIIVESSFFIFSKSFQIFFLAININPKKVTSFEKLTIS